MKIARYAPLAAALFLLSPQLASAQESHPCKADRDKFCAGMKAGDGKLGECLKQHEAELSPECAAERKEKSCGRMCGLIARTMPGNFAPMSRKAREG